MYVKVYPTYDLAGALFGVVASRPHEWVNEYLTILEEALGRHCVLPERKITSAEEFRRLYPGVQEVILDGAERPMQRPKNNKNQMQPITNHIPPAGQNVAENANIFDITAKPVTKLTLLNFCSGDERYPPILSTAHPPNRTPKIGPVADVTMKHNMTVCTGYLCGPFIK